MNAQNFTYQYRGNVLLRGEKNLGQAKAFLGIRSKKSFNYFPFGMMLPGRSGNTSEYRYGFQNQEKDDEIKGEGNSINYKYRMHDPRIGRFFAVDPLTRQYPHYTPYSFSGNKVIAYIELEGLEELHYSANIPGLGLSGIGVIDLSLQENQGLKARIEREMGFTLTGTDVVSFTGDRRTVTSTVAVSTMSLTINNNQNKSTSSTIESTPISSIEGSLTVGVQAGFEGKIGGIGGGIDANAGSIEIVGGSVQQTGSDNGPVTTQFNHCFDGVTTMSQGISGTLGIVSVSAQTEIGVYLDGGTVPNSRQYSFDWTLGLQGVGIGQSTEWSTTLEGSSTTETSTSFSGVTASFSVAFILGLDVEAKTGVETTTTTTTTTNYVPPGQ